MNEKKAIRELINMKKKKSQKFLSSYGNGNERL